MEGWRTVGRGTMGLNGHERARAGTDGHEGDRYGAGVNGQLPRYDGWVRVKISK